MDLRRMTEDDLAQVVDIHKSITRKEITPRWREMLSSHVDNSEYPGYVAENDGQVVGFIIGEIKVGGFGAELSGWIEVVEVNPDYMGQGIGGALARRLLEHFASEGVLDVLTAVRWDSGDMLAFFKNQGFDRSPFINLQLKLGQD
ncbi:MAG: GNAT family N-acetyltransferase [Desulfarculaceae bacterium]|jgi:ribosomal protein S18 acetylase RimI-like enzyme